MFPAVVFLWRVGVGLRAILEVFPRVLKALAIVANRERRCLDVHRRQLFYVTQAIEVMRNAGHKYEWPKAWQDELKVIHQQLARCDQDIMALRDTAFRAREMRTGRELREARARGGETAQASLDQGDLDATLVGPIEFNR